MREWLQLRCRPDLHGTDATTLVHASQYPDRRAIWREGGYDDPVSRVALVAGDRDDVGLRIEHRTTAYGEGTIVFPVRPGDRRFLEIDRRVLHHVFCFRYTQWFQAATFTISERWDGDQPEIVVTRNGHHPSTGSIVVGHSWG